MTPLPPAVAPALPDRELVIRLRLGVMRLARRLRQQTEGEITASQLSALSSVSRLGPLTLGALAAIERVRPPTMTRIVGHLEAAGVTRVMLQHLAHDDLDMIAVLGEVAATMGSN